jgi:hypothetical protein
MKNQEIELEKKPVQDGRIFVNSDKKKKRAKEIRICNAMELRDIKICVTPPIPTRIWISNNFHQKNIFRIFETVNFGKLNNIL